MPFQAKPRATDWLGLRVVEGQGACEGVPVFPCRFLSHSLLRLPPLSQHHTFGFITGVWSVDCQLRQGSNVFGVLALYERS
jgi:hypothetical protein